jgi:hypothetical protein
MLYGELLIGILNLKPPVKTSIKVSNTRGHESHPTPTLHDRDNQFEAFENGQNRRKKMAR